MPDVLSPPPAQSVTIIPSAPSKPIKQSGVIKLGGSPPAAPPATPDPKAPPAAPQEPKQPDSRSDMFDRLRKKGNVETPPEPKPQERPGEEAIEGEEPHEEGQEKPPADPKAPPVTPEEKKKQSPWKLVTEYKQRYAESEQRALDFEKEIKAIKSGQLPKEVQDRVAKIEARNKELEDEMRFVRYEGSQEFKEKYQTPYEKAWSRAMSELGELTIQAEGGQPRQVNSQDMLDLVNLPLGKARELANALYGDFANDVMQHRKEIRNLYEQRTNALEEAKKTGAEREAQMTEKQKKLYSEITDGVKSEWQKAQEAALADEQNGRFFKPVEGDDEWNSHLEKGFQFADSAMSSNPLDPSLSPEDRAKIVRKHNAMRNRAAAYAPMKYKIGRLEAKIAELEKDLGQFKQSEPKTGGDQPSNANGGPADARTAMFDRLRQKAR